MDFINHGKIALKVFLVIRILLKIEMIYFIPLKEKLEQRKELSKSQKNKKIPIINNKKKIHKQP
jgi:hypothetical protein